MLNTYLRDGLITNKPQPFFSKPLFGVGANNYGFYTCGGPRGFLHSIFLQVFAELGIIGGLIYCALNVTITFSVARRRTFDRPSAESVWPWFVAFAISQLLIAQIKGDYFVSAALYFVMGIAASMLDRDSIPKNH